VSEPSGGSARPVRQRRLPAGLQDSHVIVESPTVKAKKGGKGPQKAAADKQSGDDAASRDKKSQMAEEGEEDQVSVLAFLFSLFNFLFLYLSTVIGSHFFLSL
jgi:hypothetical protein